jgi:hypothetical protein
MGRAGLEARFRIFLARAALLQARVEDARRYLDDVPPDTDERTIGPELRAQVLYWRGEALRAGGDRAGGDAAIAQARAVLEALRSGLPDGRQAAFAARTDLKPIG